jgi:hypothetical protein
MDGHALFRPALKLLAAMAALGGVLALTIGVLSAMVMDVPLLSGQPKHTAIISTFILAPVLQLVCVAFAAKYESTRPAVSNRLYVSVIVIFIALAATLALA